MGTILDTLAQCAAERTAKRKAYRTLASLRADAEAMPKGSLAFQHAIERHVSEADELKHELGRYVSNITSVSPYFDIETAAQ